MARNYTDNEKIRILQELESGARISDVSRRYGVSRSTVHRWQKRFPHARRAAVRTEEAGQPAEGRQRAETEEAYIRRLEAENTRLKRIVVQQALKIDALLDKVGRRTDCFT
jgi:transposase-like protein